MPGVRNLRILLEHFGIDCRCRRIVAALVLRDGSLKLILNRCCAHRSSLIRAVRKMGANCALRTA